MPRGLQRISSGGPIPSTAVEWNQVVDGVQTAQDLRSFVNTDRPPHLWWHNAVQVKNNSGSSINTGQILVTEDILTDPTYGTDIFLKKPVVIGKAITFNQHNWGRVLIATQAIPNGEIGWAHYTGVTRALVCIEHDYHDHADIGDALVNPDADKHLISHPSGSWQILARENISGSDPRWCIVQHRGIWDRTMAGIAQANIPLDSSGPVAIYSGLHSTAPNTPTGETVTATYTYSSGEAIQSGDEVTLEWQSDYCMWTVYKFGGPAGSGPSTADAATFTVTGINRINPNVGAIYLTQVPPGDLENNNIKLLGDNWNIDLLSTGESSVSYSVILTIPELPATAAGGTSIDKQWVQFSVQGSRTSGGEQRTDILFTPAAPGLVEPGDRIKYLPSVVSVSGTALAPSGAVLYLSIDLGPGPIEDLNIEGLTVSGQLIVVQDVIA